MNHYSKIVKFENGYGASIVCRVGSYGVKDGLFEVAVLDENGDITYDTPITCDVLGYLSFQDVANVLSDIQGLPRKPKNVTIEVTEQLLGTLQNALEILQAKKYEHTASMLEKVINQMKG
jgi:hypothetical protein